MWECLTGKGGRYGNLPYGVLKDAPGRLVVQWDGLDLETIPFAPFFFLTPETFRFIMRIYLKRFGLGNNC